MKKLLATAALIVGLASGANAATLINGGFEDSTVDPGAGFVTLTSPDSSITGWTVTNGSIDYIGGYWTPEEGSRSIDLAGTSLGTLSQVIADTIAGQFYTVSFYASKNPDGGDPMRSGTVTFGGSAMTFDYSLPNDRSNMNWQLYTYTFLASGPSTLLSFAADPSAGCCYGPALDNVSITEAVPEPTTWAMMLVGFCAVGAVVRRTRRTPKLAQLA